ncbi:MAG: hypothetical protein ACQR33_04245 [Candidatus Saccharibacteria bacterium]
MTEIHQFHDPLYDTQVASARAFAEKALGFEVTPDERIAVVGVHNVARMRQVLGQDKSVSGGYNPQTDEIVVHASDPDPYYARSADLNNTKALVHEMGHSATYRVGEHAFFIEAAAGIPEYKFLEGVRKTPQFGLQLAHDVVVERAGVSLWLPGSFRAYEHPGKANTSQAIIALRGVSYGTTLQGINSIDIVRNNPRGSVDPYNAMRSAIGAVKPGLSREVTQFPETTDGIIQASAMIEQEMRDQGYKLPDPRQVLDEYHQLHAA